MSFNQAGTLESLDLKCAAAKDMTTEICVTKLELKFMLSEIIELRGMVVKASERRKDLKGIDKKLDEVLVRLKK